MRAAKRLLLSGTLCWLMSCWRALWVAVLRAIIALLGSTVGYWLLEPASSATSPARVLGASCVLGLQRRPISLSIVLGRRLEGR